MSDNPIQAGIETFQAVDEIFRARRRDKLLEESRALDLVDREARIKRDASNDAFQAEERTQKRNQWARENKAYKLKEIEAKTKAGQELTPDELQMVSDSTDAQLTAIAHLHNDVPLSLKGDKEAQARLIKNIGVIDEGRFTLGGTRYGKPTAIYGAPNVPGGFVIQGEFAEFQRDKNGNIVRDEQGNPVIDPATLRNAPLTTGKSSDPNDPVNVYQLKDIMPKILEKGKMLNAVRAKLAGLGDAGAMKEIDDENKREGALDALSGFEGKEKEAIEKLVRGGTDLVTAINSVKAMRPEKEEGIDFKEYGHGQIMFTKGPRKGQVARVPVKPTGGGSGDGSGGSGGGAKQLAKDIENMKKLLHTNYKIDGQWLASGAVDEAAAAMVMSSPEYGLGQILYQRDAKGRIRGDRQGVYIPNEFLRNASAAPDPSRNPAGYNRWASNLRDHVKKAGYAIDVPSTAGLELRRDLSTSEAIAERRGY